MLSELRKSIEWAQPELQRLVDDTLAAAQSGNLAGDDVRDALEQTPAPPPKAKTRRGDLWRLGDHRLLCGSSAEASDVDRLVDGEAIDLVNSDPPYIANVEPRSAAAGGGWR